MVRDFKAMNGIVGKFDIFKGIFSNLSSRCYLKLSFFSQEIEKNEKEGQKHIRKLCGIFTIEPALFISYFGLMLTYLIEQVDFR